jgi:hypothetical protein
MPLTPEAKQLRDLRKIAKEFIVVTEDLIGQIDECYKQPESVERGKAVARVVGRLEFVKDQLKHFGLHLKLGVPAKKQSLTPKKK